MREEGLPFGECAASWHTVWDRLYPDYLDQHDDGSAEAVLGLVSVTSRPRRTSRATRRDVGCALTEVAGTTSWTSSAGDEVYDEFNLRDDLALQQEATVAAVKILAFLTRSESSGE
jgi:hypothetical protein